MAEGSEYRGVCKECRYGDPARRLVLLEALHGANPILFSAEDTNQPKQKPPIQRKLACRNGEGRGAGGWFGETDRQTGVGMGDASGNPSIESPGHDVQC